MSNRAFQSMIAGFGRILRRNRSAKPETPIPSKPSAASPSAIHPILYINGQPMIATFPPTLQGEGSCLTNAVAETPFPILYSQPQPYDFGQSYSYSAGSTSNDSGSSSPSSSDSPSSSSYSGDTASASW